ncbi:hypothetical protein HQN87_23430 [Paenibacillus tritici]|uniref:ATP-grasp domain-containing protein n=1 Tax=Paenibacillus tritici TaxID=1873425 RepID=A0ABX2DUB8_9BACL|nr:hypothetical protein [Paenibacillus tritici]NQX48285.1 hypothetical protein [Paenibacillus tritici]
MGFKKVIDTYNLMNTYGKLSDQFCVIFVYNDWNDFDNDSHQSECITSNEKSEITNAFRSITNFFFPVNGEKEFITSIHTYKERFNYILVYSMAQNTKGIGRRCLIPLLCEHFGLYNISADFYPSVLGGNKELMYNYITNSNIPNISFPETYFCHHIEEAKLYTDRFINQNKDFIIKPNSESASIGVSKISLSTQTIDEIFIIIQRTFDTYGDFLIQEYISGKEVEVPVVNIEGKHVSPGVVEILFSDDNEILTYDIVASERYDFTSYNGKLFDSILETALVCAKILGFSSICRFDFRLTEDFAYVIDITPNPTVSSMSSTHYMFLQHFLKDNHAVYRLLIMLAIIKYDLFEPAFNSSI